jgi:chemotaxis protein CheZ
MNDQSTSQAEKHLSEDDNHTEENVQDEAENEQYHSSAPDSKYDIEDYEVIEAAVMQTARGRWFLKTFAEKHSQFGNAQLLDRLEAIEKKLDEKITITGERAAEEGASVHPQVERFRIDIIDMAESIMRTKHEIAQIKMTEGENSRFDEASNELDAIVTQTEEATSSLLEAAEKIQEVVWTMREEGATETHFDIIDDKVTEIYTACSFQDLTGQRISKVINVMRYLERRIDVMMSIWNIDKSSLMSSLNADQTLSDENEDQRPDRHLLNGPALKGEGIDQDAIDAMDFDAADFGDFDVEPDNSLIESVDLDEEFDVIDLSEADEHVDEAGDNQEPAMSGDENSADDNYDDSNDDNVGRDVEEAFDGGIEDIVEEDVDAVADHAPTSEETELVQNEDYAEDYYDEGADILSAEDTPSLMSDGADDDEDHKADNDDGVDLKNADFSFDGEPEEKDAQDLPPLQADENHIPTAENAEQGTKETDKNQAADAVQDEEEVHPHQKAEPDHAETLEVEQPEEPLSHQKGAQDDGQEDRNEPLSALDDEDDLAAAKAIEGWDNENDFEFEDSDQAPSFEGAKDEGAIHPQEESAGAETARQNPNNQSENLNDLQDDSDVISAPAASAPKADKAEDQGAASGQNAPDAPASQGQSSPSPVPDQAQAGSSSPAASGGRGGEAAPQSSAPSGGSAPGQGSSSGGSGQGSPAAGAGGSSGGSGASGGGGSTILQSKKQDDDKLQLKKPAKRKRRAINPKALMRSMQLSEDDFLIDFNEADKAEALLYKLEQEKIFDTEDFYNYSDDLNDDSDDLDGSDEDQASNQLDAIGESAGPQDAGLQGDQQAAGQGADTGQADNSPNSPNAVNANGADESDTTAMPASPSGHDAGSPPATDDRSADGETGQVPAAEADQEGKASAESQGPALSEGSESSESGAQPLQQAGTGSQPSSPTQDDASLSPSSGQSNTPVSSETSDQAGSSQPAKNSPQAQSENDTPSASSPTDGPVSHAPQEASDAKMPVSDQAPQQSGQASPQADPTASGAPNSAINAEPESSAEQAGGAQDQPALTANGQDKNGQDNPENKGQAENASAEAGASLSPDNAPTVPEGRSQIEDAEGDSAVPSQAAPNAGQGAHPVLNRAPDDKKAVGLAAQTGEAISKLGPEIRDQAASLIDETALLAALSDLIDLADFSGQKADAAKASDTIGRPAKASAKDKSEDLGQDNHNDKMLDVPALDYDHSDDEAYANREPDPTADLTEEEKIALFS